MKELISAITEPKGTTRYLYLVSGYSILICTLYLWGYWSSFSVNILQYVDISTIFKLATFPLVLGLGGLLVGSVIGHFLFRHEPSPEEVLVVQNSAVGKFLRRNISGISVAWLIITFLYFLFGPRHKWELLSVMITIPVSSMLHGRQFAADVLPDRNQRSAVIFLFVMAIPFAYSSGLRAAELIETGEQFSYVLSPIEGIPITGPLAPEARIRFLGQVTDQIFLFNPVEKSVSVMKVDDKKVFTIKRFVKNNESIGEWFPRVQSGFADMFKREK